MNLFINSFVFEGSEVGDMDSDGVDLRLVLVMEDMVWGTEDGVDTMVECTPPT